MVLAFIISVAGCWGALMVLGIFGVVVWNAISRHLLKGRLKLKTTRRRLGVANAVLSLLFNIVYFLITLC